MSGVKAIFNIVYTNAKKYTSELWQTKILPVNRQYFIVCIDVTGTKRILQWP